MSTRSSRDRYARFPIASPRRSSSSTNDLFKCNRTKIVIVIVILWLLLTITIYQMLYNVDSSKPKRRNHRDDALNLYSALNNEIKKHKDELKDLGIDLDALQKDQHSILNQLIPWKAQKANRVDSDSSFVNKLNMHDVNIEDKLHKLFHLDNKPGSTEKPTSIPTFKPTPKPTQKPTPRPTNKDGFPEYFDTVEDDTTLHDLNWIKDRMYYWKAGTSKHANKEKKQATGQYMTFWSDCGGFNNIRMGFEYMIIVAYLTERTLILPPTQGWYLIDYGRRARMNSKDSRGLTGYAEFFDFNDLDLEISMMSTQQFIQNNKDSLDIPNKFQVKDFNGGLIQQWRQWLNKKADDIVVNMAWGPLAHILNWPSINAVQTSNHKPDRMFISNRDNIEYTDDQKKWPWIHFPACDKGDPGTSRDYRYLGQVASFVWFDDTEKDNDLKRLLRDHVHLPEEVFFYAARAVEKLGAFQYAALHIRRNELQYKDSFIAASDSLKHIKPLLKQKEVLYIATDETDNRFFEPMEKEYTVYRWRDLFLNKESDIYINDIEVPRKYEGVVEMAICGMARIFFGTDTSTFTAYITRLRGYFDAPDKSTYHHNEQWSGDLKADSQRHHKLWGQTYMDEFPEMWEKIKGTY